MQASLPTDVYMRIPSIHRLGSLIINRIDWVRNKFKPWKRFIQGLLHMTKPVPAVSVTVKCQAAKSFIQLSPRISGCSNNQF